VQENTQTKQNSKKENSKTQVTWFSRLLQHLCQSNNIVKQWN